MDARYEWVPVRLAAGETFVMDEAAEAEVTVRCGDVWLTQRGDDRDLVLRAGRSLRLTQAAGVVMSTRRGAELLMRRGPAAAGGPGMWLARLKAAVAGVADSRPSRNAARDDRAARIG